jgi:hypothetical protein
MATILNRQVTFSTNGTVTAAGLHNLIDETEIYAGIITTQPVISSVGSSDQLLIADADLTPTSAPRRVTVGSMFNDALNNGVYTSSSFTGTLTAGSFVGPLNGNVTGTIVGTGGTISSLTTGTTTSTAANITNGTISNFTSSTATINGTITGSTNVINIGSGQIYKDASGNVGIGTTSPSANGLEISKTAGSNSGVKITSGTQSSEIVVNSGAGFYVTNNSTTLPTMFWTNGTERLRIDSNGNVGIGVTSPDSVLSVYAPDKTTPAISARYSAAGFKAGLSVYNSLGFPYLSFNANPIAGSDNATYDINGVASKIDFATSSGSANIIFSNAASGTAGSTISWLERMRIDSSGNCSIGTATALSTLHVHGNVTLSNTTTATSAGTGGLSKPGTYAGYLTVSINGTSRKIPYYPT